METTTKTTKYHVLQVALTDAEVAKINAEGHNAVARHARKIDIDLDILPLSEIRIEDYDHVADITTTGLNAVVNIGNSDDRFELDCVEVIIDNDDQGFASISKGDIVINSETGRAYRDTGYGWDKLEVSPEALQGILYKTEGRVQLTKEAA